ncbi:hypothetical protein BCR39DRAFT_589745 [Naematelia encephala]|uniref:DUF6534 domain-containing protein n=1 Tax=Naematelia encephala TaxID=71784 RepID=A0A1Y2AVH9_9TREE|nr:hypothetical protein BCR39DRAFT_589745 [Naematelia encephala]
MSMTIGGFNETTAAALFAPQAEFMTGCQLGSVITDTFLAGILVMQVYQYFKYQPNDRKWTRAVVIFTSAMNVVITIYYWVYTRYYFVEHYGQWLPWLEVRWLARMPTFDAVTVSVVQVSFAYRGKYLDQSSTILHTAKEETAFLLTRRNWYIFGLTLVLILAAAGGAIGVTVVFGSQPSLLGADKSGPTLITWLACTSAADVLIAGSILWGLLRSKTGWAHTDKLIGRLIRLTFEAQLLPTCLAIAYVVEWIITPASLLGASLQCKAYTVGLLASLNARVSFTSAQQTVGAGCANTGAQVYEMGGRLAGPPGQITVQVETETWIQDEGDDIDNAHKKELDNESEIQSDPATGYTSQARLTHAEALV